MLSLFGYDPDGDHHRITRQISTRRLNLALPSESLLVEKSVEAVPHTGGKRFDVDSPYYDTLVEWIKVGAPNDAKDVAKPVSIDILPPKLLLEGDGATQQMTVVARYSDGSDRVVTPLVGSKQQRQQRNRLTGRLGHGKNPRRGVCDGTLRDVHRWQSGCHPEGLNYERPTLVANNYIDELVYDKLHKLRMTPSELCTDEKFARRSFLTSPPCRSRRNWPTSSPMPTRRNATNSSSHRSTERSSPRCGS